MHNEEVTDEGHEAFKVKESVNFIIRAFDPEHELSELEIDTNNHNDKGITHPFFQKLILAMDFH